MIVLSLSLDVSVPGTVPTRALQESLSKTGGCRFKSCRACYEYSA